MMDHVRMEPLDLASDALRELGNICAGNGITALSRLLQGARVDAALSELRPTVDVVQKGDQGAWTAVVLDVSGTLHGSFALLLEDADANALGRELLHLVGGDPGEHSALMEISNIVGCAFLDAATALVGQPLVPSPPRLIRGMLGEILLSVGGENSMVLSTGFEQRDLGSPAKWSGSFPRRTLGWP